MNVPATKQQQQQSTTKGPRNDMAEKETDSVGIIKFSDTQELIFKHKTASGLSAVLLSCVVSHGSFFHGNEKAFFLLSATQQQWEDFFLLKSENLTRTFRLRCYFYPSAAFFLNFLPSQMQTEDEVSLRLARLKLLAKVWAAKKSSLSRYEWSITIYWRQLLRRLYK